MPCSDLPREDQAGWQAVASSALEADLGSASVSLTARSRLLINTETHSRGPISRHSTAFYRALIRMYGIPMRVTISYTDLLRIAGIAQNVLLDPDDCSSTG